jgi:predicted ester cyclase
MTMPKEPQGPNTAAIRKRNKTAVRRMVEAFNSGKTEIVDEVHHPKLIDHTPAFRTSTNARQGVKQQIEMYRKVFPDAHFEEEFIVAEGNMVVMRWQMTGTFKGKLFGREGNGKKISHHGHEILLFDDKGMITEHIDTFNVISFLDKLGLMDTNMLQSLKKAGVLSMPSDKSTFLNESAVPAGK